MGKADLRIDWATHEAARYACEHWHYSKCLPVGKLVKVGVWENSQFVGVILFAWGSNRNLGAPYGLPMEQCCELVRVALSKHDAPVSRMMALALRFLRSQSPGLRLVVSFADPAEGHHGGIYQAGNWIYSGCTKASYEWHLNGERLHKRVYTGRYFGRPRMSVPEGAERVPLEGKHRYLMPLDPAMRERILPLARPYPKRVRSADSGTPGIQPGGGGATPTRTLHPQADETSRQP